MALLTMKVEYIAATHTAIEAMWLYIFIGKVFDPIDKATTLFYNNQSAITFPKNGKFHAHTKYIHIQYHFICYIIENVQAST